MTEWDIAKKKQILFKFRICFFFSFFFPLEKKLLPWLDKEIQKEKKPR